MSNEGNEGEPLAQGNGSGIMGEGAQGENTGGVGDAGKADRKTAGAVELIDGFEVVDGKVGGKIPVDKFKSLRISSIINSEAKTYAIANKKTIRFSHNPLEYSGCALVDEWEYLKETLKITDTNLEYKGGFWYVK